MAGLFEVRVIVASVCLLAFLVPLWLAEVREELRLRREGKSLEV